MTLGFQGAGVDIAVAIDSNPLNVEYHQLNFPKADARVLDVTRLNASDLRACSALGGQDIDVLFGGPPCEGFSVGGHQDITDKRNRLLGHFARMVGQLRPKYFVVENVEGLRFRHGLRILRSFLSRVRKSGYAWVEPIQTLDARDFGIPQRRRRLFILGYRTDCIAPQYPRRLGRGRLPSVWDAIGDLPNIDDFSELATSDVFGGGLGTPSAYVRRLRRVWALTAARRHQPALTGCLSTKHSRAVRGRFARTDPGLFESVSRFFRLAKDGIAPTLRAGSGPSHGSFTAPRPIHPTHNRCISVREAARLHSFPDWFVFHPTRWHGFRQIGSSVPPLLAIVVARQIVAAVAATSRSTREVADA